MADFKVLCAKCNSTRVTLSWDRQGRWGQTTAIRQPIFHCDTCGMELYGAAAMAELERQHVAWKTRGKLAAPKPKVRKPRGARLLDELPVPALTQVDIYNKLCRWRA